MPKAERLARPVVPGAALHTALLLGGLALGAALVGCSERKADAASAPASRTATSDPSMPHVLATIGDEQVTMADIEARAGDELAQMDGRYHRARYQLVERTLQEILRDRVLMAEAKRQGKSAEELISAEAGGSVEPTDAEIAAWYKANGDRTGGRPIEQIRPQIADFLRNEKRKAAAARLDERLNKDRKVTINLEPYRVALDNGKAPARGPSDARVTLVEFSDFQCPFCGRFYSTLKRLEQTHGDSVRIVYRQFPLPSLHPNAFKAAEASLCADDQGKFWELHDLMFQEQERLTVKELKEKAARIGLDQQKFDECLDAGRHTEQVQEDIKAGSRVGVTGTPALFVNGVEIPGGAVSYETVVAAIRQEAGRAKR